MEKRLIDSEDFAKHLERMARTAYPNMLPGLLEAAEYAKDFPTVNAVILPCNIGETVYMIRDCSCYGFDCLNNSNSRRKCSEKVYLGKKSRKCHCGYVSEVKFGLKHIADFGKLVFLTRKDAEAALAKMGGEGR